MISVTLKPSQRRNVPVPDKSDYVMGNWGIGPHPHAWRPPTDAFEREDTLVVRVEIAGMNETDFAISLDQNVLTIRGVRTEANERRAYHQMEINFGEFLTSVDIPIPVDIERVQAEYQNGLLWVYLPKAQPKIIHIKENE